MSSESEILLQSLKGQIIPKRFESMYIVFSYLVSCLGSWTTLELIHRRTALRGAHNWLLLLGASISMGGIAIWCMHYLGNRAVILGDGSDVFQISYAPTFTVISFFVPIIVLFMAFAVVGSNDHISTLRIVMGGLLSGLGIAGMHYLGQAGIAEYDCVYQVSKVIGAIVIAVAASTAALMIFFRWRLAWETSWWKRAFCAIVLAGAVSGMHWLASVGTRYRLKHLGANGTGSFSRNGTTIVIMVLSCTGCIILFALSVLAQRRNLKSALRAKQVMLAVAAFDEEGRILVTPEGLLPTRKITDTFMERSLHDVFCPSHPIFLWIFRASRYWHTVGPLLPDLRRHIQSSGIKRSSSTTWSEHDPELNSNGLPGDYSILFRKLFCIAAAELAYDLSIPFEDIGVLYDGFVSTGMRDSHVIKSDQDDAENQLNALYMGKGQLLFLVQHVSPRRAEHLQAAGYRFADIHNVLPILSRSMRTESNVLSHELRALRTYTGCVSNLKPGVYMAFFAVRAAMTGGFEILVHQDTRSQLPTIPMSLDQLSSAQLDYLRRMDSMSTTDCMQYLENIVAVSKTTADGQFAIDMLLALRTLGELTHMFSKDAELVPQPIEVPCPKSLDGRTTATLIVFRLLAPIHSRSLWSRLRFVPLSFFKMQQRLYEGSTDHLVFEREFHRDFLIDQKADVMQSSGCSTPTDIRLSPRVTKVWNWGVLSSSPRRARCKQPKVTLTKPRITRLRALNSRNKNHLESLRDRRGSPERLKTRSIDKHQPQRQRPANIVITEAVKNVHAEASNIIPRSNRDVEEDARTYIDLLFDMFLEQNRH